MKTICHISSQFTTYLPFSSLIIMSNWAFWELKITRYRSKRLRKKLNVTAVILWSQKVPLFAEKQLPLTKNDHRWLFLPSLTTTQFSPLLSFFKKSSSPIGIFLNVTFSAFYLWKDWFHLLDLCNTKSNWQIFGIQSSCYLIGYQFLLPF